MVCTKCNKPVVTEAERDIYITRQCTTCNKFIKTPCKKNAEITALMSKMSKLTPDQFAQLEREIYEL